VNGTKAGWGFALCEQKNVDGELVMELVDDGRGPVVEQRHPEWTQPHFLGSAGQSPGQAEFCGAIETLKRVHGVALENPKQRFTFTGRPDSQNAFDAACCEKRPSNRILLQQALADEAALVGLANVSVNSFDLFHSKARLAAGKFKRPFNHRADRNAARGAMGCARPSGRWANAVKEMEGCGTTMGAAEEVFQSAKKLSGTVRLDKTRVKEATIYAGGRGQEKSKNSSAGANTGCSFRVVAADCDVEETGLDVDASSTLSSTARSLKTARVAASKGLDALASILAGSPCDSVRIVVSNKTTQASAKKVLDARTEDLAWAAGTVAEVVVDERGDERDPLSKHACERARTASKGGHQVLSPSEAVLKAKGTLKFAELDPFPLNVPLTPLPPQAPRATGKCRHRDCGFVFKDGGLAEMQAHLNRAHRSETCSAPRHAKHLFGDLCHLGRGHRLPSNSVGGASTSNHLKKCPGAVRVVDPILHEEEGGDLCQLAAVEEAASWSSTDFLKCSIFSAAPKEPVACWDGEITRTLPRALKPCFMAQSEELREY
jgi:hypothetical protein